MLSTSSIFYYFFTIFVSIQNQADLGNMREECLHSGTYIFPNLFSEAAGFRDMCSAVNSKDYKASTFNQMHEETYIPHKGGI